MKKIFIPNNDTIKTDIISIVDNYKVLHYDELPILYIGTNKFGNKIIGSLLEEDDDNKYFYKLHTILSNKEYFDFVSKKISYLDLLRNSKSICLVIETYSFEVVKAYDYEFNKIPKDYLPLENSFCPSINSNNSLSYSISLKGKLADMNKAIANEVSKIQNVFTEFIEDRIKVLKGFDAKPQALLEPYTPGSFKINFDLEIKHQSKKPQLFFQLANFDEYINQYINYLGTEFYNDKSYFINGESPSKSLKELENILVKLYDKTQIKKPKDINQFLKKDIKKSISTFEEITEEVGDNFISAEIININTDFEKPLAFIDKNFSEQFQSVVEDIEISTTKELFEDNDYNDYNIYIYHLNTDNRTGNAFIKSFNKDDEMSKPKIKIEGDESLETTKYTESIYLNKWITVKAKAKRIGEKYKYLTIKFEDE